MGTRSRMGQDRLAIIGSIEGLKGTVESATHGNRATRRASLSQLRRHNKAKAKYGKQ